MSQTTAAGDNSSKMKLLLFVLIGLLSIGAGIGGTWYVMKDQYGGSVEPAFLDKKKPATFIKLDTFTVNLQSEDHEHRYLLVELAIKVSQTEIVDIVKEKMPEIRNQILLLLSNRSADQISSLEGKRLLSQDIAEAVRQKIDYEILRDDIKDVLFTSFIIQ